MILCVILVCVIIYDKEKESHKGPERDAPRNVYCRGLVDIGQQPDLFFEQVVIFQDRLTVLLSVAAPAMRLPSTRR